MALTPGRAAELTVIVGPSLAADQYENPGVRVFATPALVRYFEAAAIEAVRQDLTPGQVTVGTKLDVRHLAATPLGMRIRFRATLTVVDGRRLEFLLEADDERERIGEGTHERFVVDLERFLARTEAKRVP